MIESNSAAPSPFRSHVFLGEGKSERKTWAVIWLCGAMMIAEIVGGLLFGSIALVADGMHMITTQAREADYYRARLARFRSLSHLTVEILHKS
jgi:Cation efflux family